MKKLIMEGPGKSVIADVPDLVPNDDQVLVKVKYCGICMSEHYDWSTAEKGKVFGHEPMGTVAAVGKNVEGFKTGDRVSGLAWEGFAEYVLFEKSNIVHIPDNLADEDAVAEPLSCLVSAASKLPVKVPGETVAVVGTGYMGLGMISLLRIKGAGKIVAVDIRPKALEDALKYGADEAYLPSGIPDQYLAPLSNINQGGLSLVSEWGETNESLHTAIEMTKIDGCLGIGSYHTGGRRLVDVQLLNVKAVDMISTHERKTGFQVQCCRNAFYLLSKGLWNYKNLPTKIYRLSEFDLAHEELEKKASGAVKLLIDCTRW